MEQFKVGNFVRHKRLRTAHKCTSINEGEFSNKISTVPSLSFDSEYMNQYELWFPEHGEWCWFMFSKNDRPFIDKFSHIQKKFILGSTIIKEYHTIGGTLAKAFCEPFIGDLPSFIKDL